MEAAINLKNPIAPPPADALPWTPMALLAGFQPTVARAGMCQLTHPRDAAEHEARVNELKRFRDEYGLARLDAWLEAAAAGRVFLSPQLITWLNEQSALAGYSPEHGDCMIPPGLFITDDDF